MRRRSLVSLTAVAVSLFAAQYFHYISAHAGGGNACDVVPSVGGGCATDVAIPGAVAAMGVDVVCVAETRAPCIFSMTTPSFAISARTVCGSVPPNQTNRSNSSSNTRRESRRDV